MKNLIVLAVMAMFSLTVTAQKHYTKNGKISFNATAPNSPENIEAVNRAVTCVLDAQSGNIQFAALMKGFEFERALMQEHFNENYVESHKYPKAEFKGAIVNNGDVNYSKDGTYNVKVTGKLSLHGQTKDVTTDGKLVIQNGKINTTASFDVQVSDFNISIPGVVADKVGKKVQIAVACTLDPLKG